MRCIAGAPRFTKHGIKLWAAVSLQHRRTRFVLVWFCFVLLQSRIVLFQFCFVLFYESAKTSANVNKLKKHRWRGGRCLLLFLVRFLSLFTLMAVENLIHDCHILIKNRDKIASSFEQARNSCDIAAIESHWNRSWFTRAIFKLQLRGDKIALSCATKMACVNGP